MLGGISRQTVELWLANPEMDFPKPFVPARTKLRLWDLAEIRGWVEKGGPEKTKPRLVEQGFEGNN